MERFESRVLGKVNLRLAVVGRCEKLHALDMIVLPIEKFQDSAWFEKRESGGVEIVIDEAYKGEEGEKDFLGVEEFCEERFLKFFAPKVNVIAERFSANGILHIKKGVPLGCGLGGSSSAVACALKVLEKAYDAKESDDEFLLSLGSDVPCMLFGRPCRVRGVGEIVEALNLKAMGAKVYFAKGGVDSGEAYKEFDKIGKVIDDERELSLELALGTSFDDLLEGGYFRNDLQEAACSLNDNVRKTIEYAKSKGEGRLVIMSGSGSSVVVFDF